MRFGIFYEHRNPRPWEADRTDHKPLSSVASASTADLTVAVRLPEMFGAAPRF
jgi:hypothetical protein